ncbi:MULTISPECIES: hypothetical protein [unclassified Streptomyces]|uniref:hypothetical protein n=1 Tax=unclassified Streptomyces TaxID=2593676 RepID=UPI003798DE08
MGRGVLAYAYAPGCPSRHGVTVAQAGNVKYPFEMDAVVYQEKDVLTEIEGLTEAGMRVENNAKAKDGILLAHA